MRGADHYLQVKTQKTHSLVRIKLPAYAVSIVEQFRIKAGRRKTIFPPLSLNQFNKQIKVLALKAGWTQTIVKYRSKRGVEKEQVCPSTASYRFCDLLSSHTMRRTAITTMLMLGMKEFAVKLISGHAFNSKSFGRYVNLAQSYLDNEMDGAFGPWVGLND